jgi:hypothetical protein
MGAGIGGLGRGKNRSWGSWRKSRGKNRGGFETGYRGLGLGPTPTPIPTPMPFAVNRQPSTVGRRPSVVSRQTIIVCRTPSADGCQKHGRTAYRLDRSHRVAIKQLAVLARRKNADRQSDRDGDREDGVIDVTRTCGACAVSLVGMGGRAAERQRGRAAERLSSGGESASSASLLWGSARKGYRGGQRSGDYAGLSDWLVQQNSF